MYIPLILARHFTKAWVLKHYTKHYMDNNQTAYSIAVNVHDPLFALIVFDDI